VIDKPTVLVLGAGASVPYGLPLGSELRDRIVSGLSSVRKMEEAARPALVQLSGLADVLSQCGHGHNVIKALHDVLKAANPRSVDIFLQNNADYIPIGKHAIAAILLARENPDKLMAETTSSTDGNNTWYQYLFYQMDRSLDVFRDAPLTIVTFNYDRSLEHFLHRRTMAHFGVGVGEARELLKTKPILHVYGDLGQPRFMLDDNRRLSAESLAKLGYQEYIGGEPSSDVVKACGERISIMPERDGGSIAVIQARAAIEESEVVYFLGCAYHPENVDLLEIHKRFGGSRLLGSGFGLGKDERRRAASLFPNVRQSDFPDHPVIRGIWIGEPDVDSLQFLRDYPVFD